MDGIVTGTWRACAATITAALVALHIGSMALASTPHLKAAPLKGLGFERARLLVVAPHPDDAMLGTGGLLDRFVRRGGRVRVVFMTSGDGYAPGVRQATHTAQPGPDAFRAYARRRERESIDGLVTLGLSARQLLFLGFPDRGLCPILRRHRLDRPPYYRSPFTAADRPPATEALVPDVEYDADDLERELADVVRDFRPTLIILPHPADEHPDHCATYVLVRDALHRVGASARRPALAAYLVHFDGWPNPAGHDVRPPAALARGVTWASFPLSAEEMHRKRAALDRYTTQMAMMAPYLLRFVRRNELFALDVDGGTLADAASRCCGAGDEIDRPSE